MTITVQVAGVQAVREQLARLGRDATRQALAATAVQVEHYIEVEAAKHNQTGALVRSLYKRQSGDAWEIGHDLRHAPHAVFVHFGTKAHVIRPKNKKVLRWAGGGLFHFAKQVKHPGNAADPWMTRAAALAPRLFEAQINERIKNL